MKKKQQEIEQEQQKTAGLYRNNGRTDGEDEKQTIQSGNINNYIRFLLKQYNCLFVILLYNS